MIFRLNINKADRLKNLVEILKNEPRSKVTISSGENKRFVSFLADSGCFDKEIISLEFSLILKAIRTWTKNFFYEFHFHQLFVDNLRIKLGRVSLKRLSTKNYIISRKKYFLRSQNIN